MDGYQILDFKNTDLSISGIIPGLFETIDKSKKPFIIHNMNFNGNLLKPMFVPLMNLNNDTYEFYISTPAGVATVSIDKSDTVTILNP